MHQERHCQDSCARRIRIEGQDEEFGETLDPDSSEACSCERSEYSMHSAQEDSASRYFLHRERFQVPFSFETLLLGIHCSGKETLSCLAVGRNPRELASPVQIPPRTTSIGWRIQQSTADQFVQELEQTLVRCVQGIHTLLDSILPVQKIEAKCIALLGTTAKDVQS